jgi:hypothetical protein
MQIQSSQMQTTIEVESCFDGVDLNLSLTRAKFEELCDDLFLLTTGVYMYIYMCIYMYTMQTIPDKHTHTHTHIHTHI